MRENPLLRTVLLAVLATAVLPASSQDVAGPPDAAVPDDGPLLARNDDPDFVRRRGVDLYQRHQASLLALGAGMEVGLVENAPEGWITVREDEDVRVRFVAACEEGPCAVVDVVVGPERLSAEALYPPVILADDEALAWSAKQLVYAEQTAMCAVPYNGIAIPPEPGEGQWTVYLIAQPEEEDVVALGGHVRVRVDPQAGSVERAEDLSPSCVLVRRNAEQRSVAITYGQSPLPAETHVMTSLLEQIVLFVGTVDGIWQVNGDRLEKQQPKGVPGFPSEP